MLGEALLRGVWTEYDGMSANVTRRAVRPDLTVHSNYVLLHYATTDARRAIYLSRESILDKPSEGLMSVVCDVSDSDSDDDE